jgi:hypothetical protein
MCGTLNPHANTDQQNMAFDNPGWKYQTFMPMVVTGFLALVAVGFLICRKEDADAQKWVYSTFGAILGYWLKGGA